MADSTISQLPTAVSVTVDDLVPVDQAGVTKKATLGQLAGFAGAFPPSINYPMGGHKFTGLGLGSATGDSVPYEQVGPLSRADEPKFAGFMNKSDVTLSWSNATRTLTITPVGASFNFYANNLLYTKTGVQSIAIPDITGNHYIYFDSNGTLTVSQAFSNDLILTYAFVATLYWNSSTAAAVPDAMAEMHQATMPAQTHLYLHDSLGTTYDLRAGGLLPSVTADGDGSSVTHIEFSATPGAIWDEDVQHIISAHALTDTIPVMYRTGATGVWTFDETSAAMVRTTGTGRAAYNQNTGATWQLTEVTDTKFLLMHLFAIPGITKKWMLVMGQHEYADINSAIAAASTEILSITGIPLAEYKDIASFVIQTDNTYTNGLKSRVRALAAGVDFIDWRFAQIGGIGQSGTGGDVVGPVGAVANDIAVFDGATGKLIKDGGTPGAIIGTAIHAATNKVTPVNADEFSIWDSVSGLLNKLSFANLRTFFVERTSATGSAILPSGTSAQRDGTPSVGYTRFNSTRGKIESWNGTAWVDGTGTTDTYSVVRLNTANGYGSTNTAIRRFTTVVTNQGTDITYADSATLGASFTINTAGVYAISYTDNFSSASAGGISLNSAQLTTAIDSITTADRLAFGVSGVVSPLTYAPINCAITLPLAAGSIIRAHTNATASGAGAAAIFTITRVA